MNERKASESLILFRKLSAPLSLRLVLDFSLLTSCTVTPRRPAPRGVRFTAVRCVVSALRPPALSGAS